MVMQIVSSLFIGGFITLALIGHVALFHAMLFRPAQPIPQPPERKLRLVAQSEAEQLAQKGAARALRIA